MKVVVLHIDALQPAYIGAYGNEWIDTPALDALAARGVVFDQHFANAPMEACSASKGEHAQRMTRVELSNLVPPWKLSAKDLLPYSSGQTEDDGEPPEPWLDSLPSRIENDDDSTFERLQLTYAAAVTKMDAKIGKLVEKHHDRVVIVTSGRGLPLGEHGTVGFSDSLHEEMVHLPLIVVWPDNRHAGRRVSALTQPMDLAPTIAELFEMPWPTAADPLPHGRSLLPLVRSPLATLRTHAVTTVGERIGVRTAHWYFLRQSLDDEGRLFVKPEDRWEMNDVASQHREIVESLRDFGAAHGASLRAE